MTGPETRPIRLGLGANAGQFAVLVGVSALVGGMVGQERTVLPLLADEVFGLTGFRPGQLDAERARAGRQHGRVAVCPEQCRDLAAAVRVRLFELRVSEVADRRLQRLLDVGRQIDRPVEQRDHR